MDAPSGPGPLLRGARRVAPFALLLLVAFPALRIAASARLEPADFTFNNGSEIQSLDPATVTGVPEGRVMRTIFEGLYVKHPRTLEPLPGSAESHAVSEDGRTWTFHMRRDARWTNGDPVTAHDFVYSWERLLNPETAAEYAYQLWYVRGAKQYTLLPSDYEYAADGAWLRVMDDGRVRVGVNGYALGEADGELAVAPLVATGREVAAGEAFVELGERRFALPVGGRVTAVNGSAGTVAERLEDPYEEGWIAELEAAPGAVETALASGRLTPGAVYRRTPIFEEHVGIRAEDDLTLVVELDNPVPYFLQLTAFYPLFPVNPRCLEEAKAAWPETWNLEWLRPENIVTNGPFRIAERRVNDRIRMVKNELYWDADSVAFGSIDVLAVENYATMLNLYLTGEVSWIDRVSTNQVHRLMPREDFNPIPYLGSYFYRVNVTKPPFDDVRVRRALALTIDRRAICEKIMKAGQVPSYSLVPPGMEGYEAGATQMPHTPWGATDADYEAAFAADVAEARALVAEAGFGQGGAPFPTFEIHYNTSEAHRDIAEVIADAWKKHLDLDARLLNQEWKVYLDTQQNLGYDVSRSAWIGDYVDPNTFLDMFVTGGENNKTGWGNAEYDRLIAEAATEFDAAARMRKLVAAEEILMRELPILPIYFYSTQSMFNRRIGGFYNNMLDEHFPKFWYWMDDEELAARRAAQPADWVITPAHGPPEGLYAPNHVPGQWD